METTRPAEINRVVDALLGPDPAIANLGGMSGASVQRLSGTGMSLILKRSASPREWHVYTSLGPVLFDADVSIPEMYSEAAGDEWWLLLEDVEQPLPRKRWLADPAVISTLQSLHNIPASATEMLPERYVPAWPEHLSQDALTLFDPRVVSEIEPLLDSIRHECQRLFNPRCLISGDPNPANWGMRDDGKPVLFDWERCTLGTPAIDLGIAVPGLGDMDAFIAVSTAYTGDDRLARDIAHAKVWSVVEFLAGCATGKTEPAFDLAAITTRVPEWLRVDIGDMRE